MTQPHTDRCTVLALAIKAKIEENKKTLGFDQIFFGEQIKIPAGKVVVVDCGTKERSLEGVAGPGGRTRNRMLVTITVYNSVSGSEEEQRIAVNELSEEIEHLLHQDTSVGGIIIHGYVERWEPGLIFRPNSMFRAVQMDFYGQTKTNLTENP